MEDAAATRRLFVALMLGRELGVGVALQVRRALGLAADERPPRHLRLVAGVDLHMTLFFLGAVSAERAGPLEESLGEAVDGLVVPRLELSLAGAFPDRRRPRVLWLGAVEREPGRLPALVEAVAAVCAEAGFEPDARPFAAHVTVGRVRREGARRRGKTTPAPAEIRAAFFALDPALEWQPREVALVESLPGGGAQAYRPVRTWPLAVASG